MHLALKLQSKKKHKSSQRCGYLRLIIRENKIIQLLMPKQIHFETFLITQLQ